MKYKGREYFISIYTIEDDFVCLGDSYKELCEGTGWNNIEMCDMVSEYFRGERNYIHIKGLRCIPYKIYLDEDDP